MKPIVFFVVGAAKAGTTSIYHYLKQHPDIYLHSYKDIACFFCEHYGMALSLGEFKELLHGPGTQYCAVGDVCSDYLTDPGAAPGIAQVFPNAKIIISLRNPVDRAFSLYLWMVRQGYEFLDTFEKALAAEPKRLARKLKGPELISPSKKAYLYFNSGLYSEQVKRFYHHFPKQNIMVVRFDDLVDQPHKVCQMMYSFLGAEADFSPQINIYNLRGAPYSIRLQYSIRRYLYRIIPNRLIPILIRLNSCNCSGLVLAPKIRKNMIRDYLEDMHETEKITGLNLTNWYNE